VFFNRPAIKRYIIMYPDKEPLVALTYKVAQFFPPIALYVFAVFYLVNPTYFNYTKIIDIMSGIEKFHVDFAFLKNMYGESYAKYFFDYVVVSTFIFIVTSFASAFAIFLAVFINGKPVEKHDYFTELGIFLVLFVVFVGIFVIPTPYNDAGSSDRFGVPVNSFGIMIVPIMFTAGNMFGIFATVLVAKYLKFSFVGFFKSTTNGK